MSIAAAIAAAGAAPVAGQPATATTPPDVQAIMEKLARREALTPQEVTRLQEWTRSQRPAGAPGGDPRERPAPADLTLEAAGFCPRKQARALATAAPDRAAYLKLVRAIADRAGAALGPRRAQFDTALAAAPTAGEASDWGMMLALQAAATSAIYVTAASALRDPDDPIAASNLAVYLARTDQLEDAAPLLLYAGALAADAPVVVANQGWLYHRVGELARARRLFERALALSPGLPAAEVGLAAVLACAGDRPAAIRHATASLDHLVTAGGWTILRILQGTPAIGRGPPLALVDPPLHADLKKTGDSAGEAAALFDSLHRGGAAAGVGATVPVRGGLFEGRMMLLAWIEARYLDEAIVPRVTRFEADMAGFQVRFAEALKREAQRAADAKAACGDAACRRRVAGKQCGALRTLVRRSHAELHPRFARAWREVRPLLIDYYELSAGVLQRGLPAAMGRAAEAKVLIAGERYYLPFVQAAMWWDAVVHAYRTCTPPPVPRGSLGFPWPTIDPDDVCDKLVPATQTSWDTGVPQGLGPYRIELDCGKIKVEVGELWIGSLQLDLLRGDLTAFMGPGLQANVGPVRYGAKAGGYATFSLVNGDFKDYGFEAAGSLGERWGVKGKARWSAIDGWQPDFDPTLRL